MGQCTSRKAAGAFAVSTTTSQRSIAMQRHHMSEKSPNDEREGGRKQQPMSKGIATSFGFRKRSIMPTFTGNPAAARRLAVADVIDRNGNRNSDSFAASSGRTTPRLAPPKKEASATRVSRFGFRQPSANRHNKISDINTMQPTQLEYRNNNSDTARIKPIPTKIISPVDSNKNARGKTDDPTKFTLQTNKLPSPEYPVHVIETKTAKTLANNNKKIGNAGMPLGDDSSSKDGSLTEDSGVDSHISAGNVDPDNGIEILTCSPTFGARRNRTKARNLGVTLTGNTFDVRDLDERNEPALPLPRLPSAFQNTGIVRERAMEYQRNIDRNRSKSGGDYGEEEKTFSEKYTNEKSLPPVKTFLKPKQHFRSDFSPSSSDDQLWGNAGEAMAEDFNCSFSSSDESKDRDQSPVRKTASDVTAAFETLMNASLNNSLPKNEIRHVLLTIEDPKFAAVAAASKTSNLLEDETSPTDSLVCSYSEAGEEGKRKLSKSSSNSKDVNEKQTPPVISCPGTPTNASNSLSLSDGKDFLIDDEIADQPALVFDETLTSVNSESFAPPPSENNTLIELTPKQRRKTFEGSPLLNRRRKILLNRSDSVETLSACESIASDDMMMDYSQSSGLDETHDRSERRHFYSLDDSVNRTISELPTRNELVREWSILAGNLSKTTNRTRLLRSRATTPSSIPDSPRSSDSRTNVKGRSSLSHSPLRLTRTPLTSHIGYESDDSVRLDRASHSTIVQEVLSMKAMLLKLKRVLHESETHNPFDTQRNGLFNGLGSETDSVDTDESSNSRLELEDLRRQVLFLQGQVEDRERIVHQLQLEMNKLVNVTSNSAPASTSFVETCNAATQTDRIRPISAGPSLLQSSPTDGNMGSLVSANETSRRPRLPLNEKAPPRSPSLWKPPNNKRRPPPPPSAETPSSPQKLTGAVPSPSSTLSSSSSIPRRSLSRPRTSPTVL